MYKNQAEFEAGDLTIDEISGHKWSSHEAYEAAMKNWRRRWVTGMNALAKASKECGLSLAKFADIPPLSQPMQETGDKPFTINDR